ncbi:BC1881 family protein [Lysinibacillus xylanilyticus]|uniref:BC1881 family protein n=1 Tax=Lysinibacillus xylanilyticus TaxID=582475 RepID=UPI003D08AF63
MTDKMSRGLSALQLKVDVDVSEALTGLKALQREAKKATQELRELEAVRGDISTLSHVPTCELQRELESREGVTTYKLGSYGTYANLRMVSSDGGDSVFIEGPAIVTVNID